MSAAIVAAPESLEWRLVGDSYLIGPESAPVASVDPTCGLVPTWTAKWVGDYEAVQRRFGFGRPLDAMQFVESVLGLREDAQ